MGRPWSEFRFYEELNDFLPREKRKRAFQFSLCGRPSVREAIESQGVPSDEVDLVLVDGEPVPLDRLLSGGERVAVYPTFERFDISSLTRLRGRPLRTPRFILAAELGELARLLRSHGLDALYRPDWDDATLLDIANDEKRILLTKERSLLQRSQVTRGYLIRGKLGREQLDEILLALNLGRVPDRK